MCSSDMKTKKTLTRLYLRAFLLALPFLILATIYVVNDPFMVIKNYADYDHPAVMIQSEGPIGWYKYKKYRDSVHYDSFILGSSCTMSFQSSDWKKHIKGNVFRLFSNSEGLGDLVIKLEALERQPHQPIRNLLIVAEPVLLNMTVEQRGVMHVMPPDVSGRSMAYYQSVFLQGFFRKDFLCHILTICSLKSMTKLCTALSITQDRYALNTKTTRLFPLKTYSIRLERSIMKVKNGTI